MAACRVATLLPSATEIVIALGASDCIVGVSHCDHFNLSAPVVTSTDITWEGSEAVDAQVRSKVQDGQELYLLNEKLLESVKPDVVITQDLCDVCAVPEKTVRRTLADKDASIVSLTPHCLQDILSNVSEVGKSIGKSEEARKLVASLVQRVDRVRAAIAQKDGAAEAKKKRVAVIEWIAPLFVSGHWVPQMVKIAGGEAVPCPAVGAVPEAHPEWGAGFGKSHAMKEEDLFAADPDIIVLAPCGLGLDLIDEELKKVTWLQQTRAWREGAVYAVDGNQRFAIPAPSLVEATEWLAAVICNDNASIAMPQGFPFKKLV